MLCYGPPASWKFKSASALDAGKFLLKVLRRKFKAKGFPAVSKWHMRRILKTTHGQQFQPCGKPLAFKIHLDSRVPKPLRAAQDQVFVHAPWGFDQQNALTRGSWLATIPNEQQCLASWEWRKHAFPSLVVLICKEFWGHKFELSFDLRIMPSVSLCLKVNETAQEVESPIWGCVCMCPVQCFQVSLVSPK